MLFGVDELLLPSPVALRFVGHLAEVVKLQAAVVSTQLVARQRHQQCCCLGLAVLLESSRRLEEYAPAVAESKDSVP